MDIVNLFSMNWYTQKFAVAEWCCCCETLSLGATVSFWETQGIGIRSNKIDYMKSFECAS